MKNLMENYYAWEQAQEKQFEKLRSEAHLLWRFAKKHVSLVAFLLLKVIKNILILLFLSESRLMRIHDENSNRHEEIAS